jgi:hypothetical protein
VASTRDRIADRAGTMKPYVERAMTDEKVREDVRDAVAAAREIYDELIGNRGITTIASRIATDQDIQDTLRRALDDLRSAADRVQGNKSHTARNVILFSGIVIGVLFNPVTGPATREWLKGLIGGGSGASDFGGESASGTSSSNGT